MIRSFHRIDLENRVLIQIVDGEYQSDDLKTALEEAKGDPRYRGALGILVDASELKFGSDSPDSLKRFFDTVENAAKSHSGRFAVVIDRIIEPLLQPLDFQVFGRGHSLGYFTVKRDAMEFLNVDFSRYRAAGCVE